MPSRLSSLLVRDGLVGVKRMEQAFQRQVIYGGSLDTILLEMKMVPEERLIQYLSLATGLPPATRTETEIFDPAAIKRCPQDVALQYQVVPVAFEEDSLRVLVRDPVDLSRLEELADDIETPIQPLVVPEYRFHVVFDRAFGREPNARFATLAKAAADERPSPAVGKARSVIIETSPPPMSDSEEHEVVDVALPPSGSSPGHHITARGIPDVSRTKTQEITTEALSRHLAETEHARRESPHSGDAAPTPVATSDEVTAPATSAAIAAASAPEVPTEPSSVVATPARVEVTPAAAPSDQPEPAAAPSDQPEPAPTEPAPTEPAPPIEFVAAPLDAASARAALAAADDRDLIFGILLRAIRDHASYAGLLTIQGRAAIGRIAIDGHVIDRDEIGKVLIPLDNAFGFAKAVESAAPYIGPIATGDPEIDSMISRMGGTMPPAALLLPVVIRNRVVAIAIGHRASAGVEIAEVSELLPLAGDAAEAVSRLIMRSKSLGYRAAATDAVPEVTEDEVPTKEYHRDSADWSVPQSDATPEPVVDFAGQVDVAEPPAKTIDQVLDRVESNDEDEAAEAIAEAVRRGEEALGALRNRFPGKLRMDRYEMGGRILRAAEHGPLLDVVIQLGASSADLLIEKMRDTNRDVRYYATLCSAELRPRSALNQLVERLFDSDYGIRSAAVDALSGYPQVELDHALEFARHALHSEDSKRVQAAARAVVDLADVAAIPDLLDANARGGDAAMHARHALEALTKQEFGNSNRKWRAWWGKNKDKSRIEWLIEGLGSRDENLRRSAAEDLRKLTGEYFGYHHDLSRRERQEAQKRWQTWWNETGRRRFLRHDPDERHRPTAMLPARRDRYPED